MGVNMETPIKCDTVGKLIDILSTWPRGTRVFADISPAINNPAGDYEWHDVHAWTPSESELAAFNRNPDETSFMTLHIDPEIQGA